MRGRRPSGAAALLALAFAAILAVPAPGTAAPADGTRASTAAAAVVDGSATLVLDRNALAARGMRREGVRVLRRSPARAGRAGGIRFPVSRASVGSTATATLRGGLTFRAGRRELHVTGLQARVSRSTVAITGKVAGRRMTIFGARRPGSRLQLNRSAGRVSLRPTAVRLGAQAAARIRARLGLDRLPAGTIGTLTLSAVASATPGAGAPSEPGGTTPPGSAPPPQEPPVLARPATAVDVTGATITWRVRESFIRYINAGEGTEASDGATGADAEVVPPSSEPLVYSFHFPFARGWHDPVTGASALYYAGAVRFSYQAHGIDFRAKEPEIEINGDASRAIFRFDGHAGSELGNRRGVLVDLTPGTPTRNGNQVTYERMPGTIPEDAQQSVFAGFYAAGDEFGWISVSFTFAS